MSRALPGALVAAAGLALALGWAAGRPTRFAHGAGPGSAAAAAARVEPGRAHAWLAGFQEALPDRSPGRAAHAAAPAYVASALVAAGAVDARVDALPWSGGVARNVHARVPGRDGSRAIVLAAHHDTVPGAPGAVDDGGAVAALVEAARALSAGPRPACDVELAVFDLEERGLVGARLHLEALGAPERDRLQACLAVELVGWRRDRLVVQTIPWGFATRAEGIVPAWLPDAVRAAAADAGVPVGLGDPLVSPSYQATIRSLGVRTGSDACAYLAAGVPAALLTGSSLTNFYDEYHRPGDDLTQVDATRLDEAARAVVAAAVELAAVPPARATRRQGDVYLTLGRGTLGAGALRAAGLLVAAALLASALLGGPWSAARRALRGLLALDLAALAAWPSLLGLAVLLAPAGALALGARRPWPWRLALVVVVAFPLAEGTLVLAASAAFGLRWREAFPGETALVLLGALLALAAATGGRAPLDGAPGARLSASVSWAGDGGAAPSPQ